VPRARKSLGQNFLVDPNIQRKIVDALDPGAESEVLEIGPGRGALTDRLAGTVGRLVAVEKDHDLAAALQARYAERSNVSILDADILEVPLDRVTRRPAELSVVGNIPYNITTPILFRLLDRSWRPAQIVLMVQREVADRITAAAGTEEYGALSVGVQTVARVERLFHVGRNAFRPVPNVDSTVIRITPIRPFQLSLQEERDLRTLTMTTFNWRRKQLQRTLRSSPAYHLDGSAVEQLATTSGIDLRRRPETLEPLQFIQLSRALRQAGLPHQPT